MSVSIQHISYYLPEGRYSNADFFNDFPDMRDNGFVEKIGVRERTISANRQTASDLGVLAARKLMTECKLSPKDIDFLIYSSVDFDYYFPSTSIFIHGELGLRTSCGTLDQTHGCSAYVYGLSTAKGLIESNQLKNVLLINSNTLTKKIHPRDKASRFLFGDAAAATLITKSDIPKVGKMVFGTFPAEATTIIIPDGWERNPLNKESLVEYSDEYGNVTTKSHYNMDGAGVFSFSVKHVPQFVNEVLAANDIKLNEIDFFVFHQANQFMVESIAKKLQIPLQKVVINYNNIGNTVGASIPIAYKMAVNEGTIKSGMKIALIGFGVGMSVSGTVIIA